MVQLIVSKDHPNQFILFLDTFTLGKSANEIASQVKRLIRSQGGERIAISLRDFMSRQPRHAYVRFSVALEFDHTAFHHFTARGNGGCLGFVPTIHDYSEYLVFDDVEVWKTQGHKKSLEELSARFNLTNLHSCVDTATTSTTTARHGRADDARLSNLGGILLATLDTIPAKIDELVHRPLVADPPMA